jgi:CRP-like cAMP-binding protein
MSRDYLFKFLNEIHPLKGDTQKSINSFLKPIKIPKKDFILREGDTCNKVIFITKGLARAYYVDDGKDITTWFMKEGNVIFSIISFLTQTKGEEFIQAEEDLEGFYITYEELQLLYKKHMEFNIIGRILVELYYMLSERRNTCIRMRTSKERYEYLLKYHSDLLLRAPRAHLATFVGVTPETLSRLKRPKSPKRPKRPKRPKN